jgi:dTDP-4-dehydrorhamnose 3,5-epimerase
MPVKPEPLTVEGVALLRSPVHRDDRGWFRKPFQRSEFAAAGLPVDFSEQFFSHSTRGVVRGLHLQLAPSAQVKLVTCLAGSVFDVVLDVRAGSATAGQHCSVELSADNGAALLIPPGCAHGFLTTSDTAVLGYWVTAEFDAAVDTGVRWDSAGIDWPLAGPPIISARDLALAPLAEFGLLTDTASGHRAA